MKPVKVSKAGFFQFTLETLSSTLDSITEDDIKDKEVRKTVYSILGVRK